MANICSNNLWIAHKDVSKIELVLEAIERKELFATFVPVQEGESQSAIWGTKWDAYDLCLVAHELVDTNSFDNDSFVQVEFSTAWAPPIEFYQAMEQQGFIIIAHYSEPGMQFCGSYEDGNEYNYDTSEGLGDVPSEIIAMFGLDYDEDVE
jgi:hypothetical protein